MNQELFQIMCIQKKMERNRSMRFKVKAGAAAVVGAICLWALVSVEKSPMFVLWLLSFPVLVLLYFLDLHFVKEGKELEFDKFRLEVERREHYKELAKYKKEFLRDYELEHLDQSFERPSWDLVRPVNYYLVLVILNVLNLLLILLEIRVNWF